MRCASLPAIMQTEIGNFLRRHLARFELKSSRCAKKISGDKLHVLVFATSHIGGNSCWLPKPSNGRFICRTFASAQNFAVSSALKESTYRISSAHVKVGRSSRRVASSLQPMI